MKFNKLLDSPEELGQLRQLRMLDLSFNKVLQGASSTTLPDFASLEHLQVLGLRSRGREREQLYLGPI